MKVLLLFWGMLLTGFVQCNSRYACDVPIKIFLYTFSGKVNRFNEKKGHTLKRQKVENIFQKLRGAFNKFPDFFFVQASKIVIDSSIFSMLLLYILWDDWPIFSDSRFTWTSTAENGIHGNWNTKPDCHSWWISKMQSGREDALEERYTIKLCFKLGKMPQKRMECFRLLWCILQDRASVFEWHKRFKEGIESVKDDEMCGRSKDVNTPELIGQRVRLRVTMLRF